MELTGVAYGESRDVFLRGPARLEGDAIVIDRSRLVAWRPLRNVSLVTKGHPLVELANVVTVGRESLSPERKAVAFADQFGLLHRLPDDPGEPWSQLVASFLDEAVALHRVAGLYLNVQLAMVELGEGDREALTLLRNDWASDIDAMYERFGASQSDEELFLRAAGAVGDLVSRQLAPPDRPDRAVTLRVSAAVREGLPESFVIDPYTPDLLAFCYDQLAHLMTSSVGLRACQECGRYFAPSNRRGKRQLYCTPEHGTLARVRRYRQVEKGDTQ